MNAGYYSIDHVAIAVRDAAVAMPYYRDRLGLIVVKGEMAPDKGM